MAVGGPAGPALPGHWDLRPLIAVAVALYVLHRVFRVRLTPVVAFFAFLTAPLFLPIADVVGYDAAAIFVLVVGVIAAVALRRTQQHG